jgi:hypothetical protein
VGEIVVRLENVGGWSTGVTEVAAATSEKEGSVHAVEVEVDLLGAVWFEDRLPLVDGKGESLLSSCESLV